MAEKPIPPTAEEIEADIRRQFAALGIDTRYRLGTVDAVYEALVELARETRAPVGSTAIAKKIKISGSTATEACQQLVTEGRAYPVPLGTRSNRYVPKVV